MKIQQSSHLSPFGGLNFVLEEFENLQINEILDANLPKLATNSYYTWKDLIYSFWSIYFCGGSCIEDLNDNFKNFLKDTPFMHVPSPDRILSRFKDLSKPKYTCKTKRGKAINEFSENTNLNLLNIRLLKRINPEKYLRHDLVLDYDNTIIFTEKADAKNTYLKAYGYQPGVAIIGSDIVGIQNRNGNSVAYALQEKTLEMMFENLRSEGIAVDSFRADSASYKFDILNVVNRYANKVYVRVKMRQSIYQVINQISNWEEIKTTDGRTLFRGSSKFTPFRKTAREDNKKDLLREYKIVVTKENNLDGQLNVFTNEACVYSCIMTNDFEKSDDDIVFFYNQRGAIEREFDVLKNDFGWKHMPFSKLEQNTVFLLLTAMCRNLYGYIIHKFSKIYKYLKTNFRIKKFIFRFVCIPAKWIKHARCKQLRIYGKIAFKT
ncbi:IS1380 family transposase [Ancylomarina longa]|uniref:IS1380 family transposase n=1 Tax=Ancylomarina longa TaxID=2487017 RepID=A0A434AZG4_9BACT|nr:IS1380 family transposase [Ancylomarina longa]RUT79936.1 IS1380 family transposase [Ancylomarina longa]